MDPSLTPVPPPTEIKGRWLVERHSEYISMGAGVRSADICNYSLVIMM